MISSTVTGNISGGSGSGSSAASANQYESASALAAKVKEIEEYNKDDSQEGYI
jgi:hypothetical protein